MTQHIAFLEVGVGQYLLHDLVARGVAFEPQLQRLDGDRLTGIHRHDHIIAAQQPLLGIAERDLGIVVTEGLQRFLGAPDDLILIALGRCIALKPHPGQEVDHIGRRRALDALDGSIDRQRLRCKAQAATHDQRRQIAMRQTARPGRSSRLFVVATHDSSFVECWWKALSIVPIHHVVRRSVITGRVTWPASGGPRHISLLISLRSQLSDVPVD